MGTRSSESDQDPHGKPHGVVGGCEGSFRQATSLHSIDHPALKTVNDYVGLRSIFASPSFRNTCSSPAPTIDLLCRLPWRPLGFLRPAMMASQPESGLALTYNNVPIIRFHAVQRSRSQGMDKTPNRASRYPTSAWEKSSLSRLATLCVLLHPRILEPGITAF